jgi:hypothetical protein
MKLIDKTTLENITFYVLVFSLLLFGITTFISALSCTSDLWTCILCITSIVLVILGVATGCEIVFKERKLLAKVFADCGIVTTESIFNQLKATDIIHFYKCRYTGKSDTPEVDKQQTWIIEAKGEHYVQVFAIEQAVTWNLLPRDFYKLFDDMPVHYNKILVNDQVIYYNLK